MIPLLALLGMATAFGQPAEVVGQRPYEMDWAGRVKDDHPPLVDFEDLTGWTVQTKSSEARFERTREQQIWGRYVGKLTYRGTGTGPEVTIVPPSPIKIETPFDAVSCWIYGNNWAYEPDPTTPAVSIVALFQDPQGQGFSVPLAGVIWKEWFLCWQRLAPDQIARVANGGEFLGIQVTGGRNKEDRVLYFDNLAVFVERFPPLTFQPRPQRGIPMFPGQTTGTNTGPGRLPFPTRPETILPGNLTRDFKTSLTPSGNAWVFTYQGSDGKLTYRYEPKTGDLGDVTACWAGRGREFRPCVGGGACLRVKGVATVPDSARPLGTERKGDTVVAKWRLSAGDVSVDVAYTFRLWAKSLVVDVFAPGGKVVEVRYGHAEGLEDPRLVYNPYYVYSYGTGRPAVVLSGSAEAPLFLAGNTDWYLSNASVAQASPGIIGGAVTYQGGTLYIPKTDGKLNDVYERFFLTVSPRYEEVLPAIANPASSWKKVTGTHLWRAHGASNRELDKLFWAECRRYGMTQVIVTDHETGWRDGGESFTFRTRAAPGKGGDQGQFDYARFMQDKLGFVYGPYNTYTDFAPVNEYWSPDLIARTSDNQLMGGWMRCYAVKPSRAVEYCAMLAPKIQAKFHFSTAYCDVHTCLAPWDRVDYDARVPGAATFGATFYSYGEVMLLQKAAWKGPVYSEGGHHAFYCGLTDGNYGQDQTYGFDRNPWLVDFDLRRMHDLCCNFGMGNGGMFYGNSLWIYPAARSDREADAIADRFLAATVAFGHPGFLNYEGGTQNALRSYYMLQQLHSRYCLASADEIHYVDAEGKPWPTTQALARGAYMRSQVVTRYSDGTVTAVNGNPRERMTVEAYGHKLDLPPNGYAGWTKDGSIDVISTDPKGHRCDHAVTPAYIYVDGRGRFMRFPKAGGSGIGICRLLGGGRFEVIPYQGADCGFAITATSAVALDKDGKEIGPARLRVARGLTYVVPVAGAFSYMLAGSGTAPAAELQGARDEVVAGEKVVVQGAAAHELQIPADAKVGDRIWREVEGRSIDFTVVPLAETALSLAGNDLVAEMTSNLAQASDTTLAVRDTRQTVRLEPGKRVSAQVDLGPPIAEDAEVLTVELSAGDLRQVLERGLRTVLRSIPLGSLPDRWQGGICQRGAAERYDLTGTGAFAVDRATTCGDDTKPGLAMHPPWMGGVGYTFALHEPMTLPDRPVALRAMVGKGDGSDPGDGILYKIAVVDESGKQTIADERTVTEHKWMPLEADLTPWAGKRVRIKLISDVGIHDDPFGDWACWAEMRLESRDKELARILDDGAEACRRAPGPFPVAGLTVDQMRGAKRGWLHYEGMGLQGGEGQYGSSAAINGADLGPMKMAAGDEAAGIWSEDVTVPLTPAAIATLGYHNTFELRNSADWFKVRRFWIELELADGRKCSSLISTAAYTQPPEWPYAEGIGVPFGRQITVDIWFKP